MTDKEKIKFWTKGRMFEIMNGIGENDAKNILTDLLSFIDSLQEEPKKCLFTKDSYTNEDRKVLCKDCDERCEYNKKEKPVSKDFEMALAEMVDKAQKCVVEPLVVAEQWKDELIKLAKSEELVSEEFEEALAREWQGYNDRGAATVDALEDNTQELAFAKGFYRGAKWQKEQMIAKTIDAHCFGFQGAALFSFRLPADNYLVGSKVKVIVIKED